MGDENTLDESSIANRGVRIGEHVVLPLIIVLGLATNGLCLKLLRSDVLRKTYMHKYITLLICLDIVSFVFHIPKIFGHCPISNYNFAVYMTKVNWVIILFLRTISIYILVFISYDRFLAIWMNEKFQDITENEPFKKRMSILFIWCLLSNIPAIFMGEVKEIKSSEGNKWISIPALKVNPTNSWGEMYGVYTGTLFVGLPIALVVGLSIGLVFGIVLKKSSDINKERTRTQLLKTVAVLALNISFGFLFVPYSALILRYDKPDDKCYRSAFEESLLFGLYSLVLIWSAFNGIIYVLLNQAYMKEFKRMLYTSRLFPKCLRTDSDNKPTRNYSTFNYPNKGVDVEPDENKDVNNDIKEPLKKSNCIKDDQENTKNSSDISPNYTSEAFEPEQEPVEKDNCINDEPDSTKRHIVYISTNHRASKVSENETLGKYNYNKDEPENTKRSSDISPNHFTNESLDPEKEPLGKENHMKDEPECTKLCSDISPNHSTNDNCMKDEPESTKKSSDISPNDSMSEAAEPDIKQSSNHEYDVKKANGTLEDAARHYKSTASISFNK